MWVKRREYDRLRGLHDGLRLTKSRLKRLEGRLSKNALLRAVISFLTLLPYTRGKERFAKKKASPLRNEDNKGTLSCH